MKRTILISTLALIFTLALHTFSVNSGYAGESKKAGIVWVSSNAPNSNGTFCGTQSGSFTTDSNGGVKLVLPNGTYTICINGSGGTGGAVTIVINNNNQTVNCSNGALCPCGDY
jgi:hypothetical protein